MPLSPAALGEVVATSSNTHVVCELQYILLCSRFDDENCQQDHQQWELSIVSTFRSRLFTPCLLFERLWSRQQFADLILHDRAAALAGDDVNE